MSPTFHRLVSTGILSVLITACSDEPHPTPLTIKPFEAQTQALEQAKQLDQSVQDTAEAQRKAMEAQLN
jgi:hypothetical protein